MVNSPSIWALLPGTLPVCFVLITYNMHTNVLNNFAREIYICSGLLIYGLKVIVVFCFFPITEQLLLFQMLSEDFRIHWACNASLAVVPIPFFVPTRTPSISPIPWLLHPPFPSPQLKQPHSLCGKQSATSLPAPDCDYCLFDYSYSRMAFINCSITRSLPCTNKSQVKRLT